MRYQATVSETADGIHVKVAAFDSREPVLLDRVSKSVTDALRVFQHDNPVSTEISGQLTASVCLHYASLIQQNLNDSPATSDPKTMIAEIQAGAAIVIRAGLRFASRQLHFPEMEHCSPVECLNAQLALCIKDHKAIIRFEIEKRNATEQQQIALDANFDTCNRMLMTILTDALNKYEADHQKSRFKLKDGGNKKIAGTRAVLASIQQMQGQFEITTQLFGLMEAICLAPGYDQRGFLIKELNAHAANNPLKIMFPELLAVLERDAKYINTDELSRREKAEMIDGGKIVCYSYEIHAEGGIGIFSFDELKLLRLNQRLLFHHQPSHKVTFDAAVKKYGDALKNGVLPDVISSVVSAAAPGLQQQTVFRRSSGSTELSEEIQRVDRRPEDTGPH